MLTSNLVNKFSYRLFLLYTFFHMLYRTLNEPLLERVFQTSHIILNKKDVLGKISSLQLELNSLSPGTALNFFNFIATNTHSIEICIKNIDKITNLFYKHLIHYEDCVINDYFLKLLSNENKDILKIFSSINTLLHQFHSLNDNELSKKLLTLIRQLEKYKSHYNKQERYLFPIFNKVLPQYLPYIKVSKQCHQNFRYILMELKNSGNKYDKKLINKRLEELYFRVLFSVYREELVFFPMCQQFISYDLKKYLYE